MEQQTNTETEAPPLGVLQTIVAGFEITTSHIWLLILPVLIDTFLWLGPRLTMQSLVDQYVAFMTAQDQSVEMLEQIQQMSNRLNLFTTLHLPVIGVPSLISSILPENSPVSNIIFEIENPFLLLFFMILFSGIGFALTAIFVGTIAGIVRKAPFNPIISIQRFAIATGHFVGLVLSFILIVVLMGVFALPFLGIGSLINPAIAGMILFLLFMINMWVAIYLGFAIHDIYLNETPFWIAMLNSVRLVRHNLTPAMGIFVGVYVINYTMRIMWQVAESGSWLTFLSIIGHAFISTSLIIATFIFFQDRIKQLPEQRFHFKFVKRSS